MAVSFVKKKRTVFDRLVYLVTPPRIPSRNTLQNTLTGHTTFTGHTWGHRSNFNWSHPKITDHTRNFTARTPKITGHTPKIAVHRSHAKKITGHTEQIIGTMTTTVRTAFTAAASTQGVTWTTTRRTAVTTTTYPPVPQYRHVAHRLAASYINRITQHDRDNRNHANH